jgi:hypothetical protein
MVGEYESDPNMNYELLVDGEEYTGFRNFSLSNSLSALSSFNFNIGDTDRLINSRFQFNAEIEFKASWGNNPLVSMFRGFIKRRSQSLGQARVINISGIDFGDYMLREKPWDRDYQPLVYTNERVSSILANLVSLTPQLKFQITKIPNEPRLSYTTNPSSDQVLDAFKTVAEYGGYEWFIIGDRIICRPPKSLTQESASYNLIMGQEDTTLPELPNVWLYGSNIDEDAGSIRNVYEVTGAEVDGETIFAVAKNTSSIQQFRGEFEGFYSDPNLTSVQSCYTVAKQLAEVNGVERTSVGVRHKGVTGFRVGDVVGLGDVRGAYEVLANKFVRVVTMDHNFGMTWQTACQMGTQRRKLSDLF